MSDIQDLLVESDSRMKKSLEVLRTDLDSIRAGRASPALVDNIKVEYYGVSTPLSQIAMISVPEPRELLIQPWDKQVLIDVEKGLLASDLGLVPNNDGKVIRLKIPIPTEERRRELLRLVNRKVEESHVAVRNIRRDSLRELEKRKGMSIDDLRRSQTKVQEVTDSYIVRMDELGTKKKTEVMEV